MDITERINEEARRLFFSHGLKSTSMDDIAKQCGISKQTIYKNFQNKNAIVLAVVNELISSHNKLFEEARSSSVNAIDEVLKQDASISAVCNGLRPSFFYELETFFPAIWETLVQYKSRIYNGIVDNLDRGKREGIYRKEMTASMFADMRLQQLLNAVRPEQLTELNLTPGQATTVSFTMLYLQALTTEKGKGLLHHYLRP